MAGPHFARNLLGHELSEKEVRRARTTFGVTYGVMWGLVYAGLREKYPSVPRLVGLPFAIPFFLGCDGALAPLLGISPGIQKLPWQVNAKEVVNHVAWTMAAETVHRLAVRFPASETGEIVPRAARQKQKEPEHEAKIKADGS